MREGNLIRALRCLLSGNHQYLTQILAQVLPLLTDYEETDAVDSGAKSRARVTQVRVCQAEHIFHIFRKLRVGILRILLDS